MISKEYIGAIGIIVNRFSNTNIKWYLAGKTNLALQGINIKPSQVGIVIHYEDLAKFLDIFSEFKRTDIEELTNGEAKEFVMTISDVPVLVCAEYLHGAYWVINKNPVKIKIENLEVPCFSLESERDAYTKIGLLEKAKIIRDFLEKRVNKW